MATYYWAPSQKREKLRVCLGTWVVTHVSTDACIAPNICTKNKGSIRFFEPLGNPALFFNFLLQCIQRTADGLLAQWALFFNFMAHISGFKYAYYAWTREKVQISKSSSSSFCVTILHNDQKQIVEIQKSFGLECLFMNNSGFK